MGCMATGQGGESSIQEFSEAIADQGHSFQNAKSHPDCVSWVFSSAGYGQELLCSVYDSICGRGKQNRIKSRGDPTTLLPPLVPHSRCPHPIF